MATTQRPTEVPQRFMQGIAVPAESVRPQEFFARTRRHRRTEKSFAYTGQAQEPVALLKSDILSEISIQFSGQVVITPGTGAVATTARWPYDFLKSVFVTANGASNLINCSGAKLKARELMKKSDLTDRGVSQIVAGIATTQGTMALAGESWGVGHKSTAIAGGTYDINLEWTVPIAEDQFDLAGAIFLATSSTGIVLNLNLATPAELFVLTGNGTAALTGDFQITPTKYSIPVADGAIVVPDLSMFHSLIETRVTGLQNGENEPLIIGQGAGKVMLRTFFQVWNGIGAAAVPLAMNKTNFGELAWRHGTNETPDSFLNGNHMRISEERRYNSDIGKVFGFGCHDFANENSFRDVVDLGTTADLRLVTNIQAGVALTSPAMEYVIETMFAAGQGA